MYTDVLILRVHDSREGGGRAMSGAIAEEAHDCTDLGIPLKVLLKIAHLRGV